MSISIRINNPKSSYARKHLFFVDGMLALLMPLVILGHCMMPGYPAWYLCLHSWIYTFHMAGFFAISGLLAGYTFGEHSSYKDIGKYLWRRLRKFGLPFALLGIPLCIVITISRDGGTTEILQSIAKLFLDTMASPVIYLWFVIVLMEYYVLTPLLLKTYKWSIIPAIAISLLLYYHPLPRFLCLHTFSTHLFFFLLGLLANRHLEQLKRTPVWLFFPPMIVFIFHTFHPLDESLHLFVQMSAVWTIGVLGYYISHCPLIRPYCSILARNSYEIYLFQMVFLHILWHLLIFIPTKDNIRFIMLLCLSLPCAIFPSIAIANNRIYQYIIGDKRGVKCA